MLDHCTQLRARGIGGAVDADRRFSLDFRICAVLRKRILPSAIHYPLDQMIRPAERGQFANTQREA